MKLFGTALGLVSSKPNRLNRVETGTANPFRIDQPTKMRLKTRNSRAYRLSIVTAVVASTAFSTLLTCLGQESSGVTPKTLHLRLKRFELPFSVDPVGNRPTEVQLFVSRDAGKQWVRFASQPPTEKAFLFDTPSDGEYWFATRTVDASGVSRPSGPVEAQLHVHIDTTDPDLTLIASLASDTEVDVTVQCADVSPDQASFRLEYLADTSGSWAEVPSFRDAITQSENEQLQCSVKFTPSEDWHQLSLRAIVKDLAGNQTIATHQLQRPRLAATPGQLASSPLGRAENPYAVKAMQVLNPPPMPAAPPTAAAPPTVAVPVSTASDAPPTFASMATEQIAVPNPDAAGAVDASSSPVLMGPGQSNAPDQARTIIPQRRPASPSQAMRPLMPEEVVRPEPQTPSPSNNQQSVSRPSLGSSESLPADLLPRTPAFDSSQRLDPSTTSSPIRYSGSRKFSLDYEVESAGRAGVEEVELWGTSDRGTTWKRWGADPDRQTPFDIETNNDGVYGFCIVVVAKNGLATPRPLQGTPPDMFIVVDTLKPVARITGATYGEGDQTGSLLIRYTCEDENVAPRPISLSFSNSPQGPWTTIAAGLENSGGYVWPADPQLPRQLYLRIDATDLASNSSGYVLDTPIDIQGLAPRARIRGFNPITRTTPASDSPAAPTPQTATVPSASFK
jgi:hypothetical protein